MKTTETHASTNMNKKPVTEASGEDSSDRDDALETTYVSETDLDVTELETLPYTKSPQDQGRESERTGAVQDHSDVTKGQPEVETHSQTKADAAEDDDALRLVREIFFT